MVYHEIRNTHLWSLVAASLSQIAGYNKIDTSCVSSQETTQTHNVSSIHHYELNTYNSIWHSKAKEFFKYCIICNQTTLPWIVTVLTWAMTEVDSLEFFGTRILPRVIAKLDPERAPRPCQEAVSQRGQDILQVSPGKPMVSQAVHQGRFGPNWPFLKELVDMHENNTTLQTGSKDWLLKKREKKQQTLTADSKLKIQFSLYFSNSLKL